MKQVDYKEKIKKKNRKEGDIVQNDIELVIFWN